MDGRSRGYLTAVAASVAAILPYLFFGKSVEPTPFLLYLAAVVYISMTAGNGPAVLTALLGVAASFAFYRSRAYPPTVDDARAFLELGTYLLASAAVITVNARRSQAERDRLTLVQLERGASSPAGRQVSLDDLEAFPLPLAILDEAGRLLRWNHQADEAFGWTASEMVGRSPAESGTGEEARLQELVRRVLGGGGAQTGEVQIGHGDRRVEVMVTAVKLTGIDRGQEVVLAVLSPVAGGD